MPQRRAQQERWAASAAVAADMTHQFLASRFHLFSSGLKSENGLHNTFGRNVSHARDIHQDLF